MSSWTSCRLLAGHTGPLKQTNAKRFGRFLHQCAQRSWNERAEYFSFTLFINLEDVCSCNLHHTNIFNIQGLTDCKKQRSTIVLLKFAYCPTIHPFSITGYLYLSRRGLEPIPAGNRRKVGYTRDKSNELCQRKMDIDSLVPLSSTDRVWYFSSIY